MKNNSLTSFYSNTINDESPNMGCFGWIFKTQNKSCLTCKNSNTTNNGSPCMGCGEYANWEAKQ